MSELTVDQAIALALEHQKAGQLGEAEGIFRQILGVYPDQADCLHLLGAVYLQAKRPDLAESNVRHALLLRSEPAFTLTLGLILQATGRVDEAIANYQFLLMDRPDFLDGHLHLGVALSIQSRFEEAAAAFQKAVKIAPENAVAQGNLGVVLCHLKRWDEAHWILREALGRAPHDADFHATLGAALYFKKQNEPALAECRQAISLNPRQGQAHNIMANIFRDSGRLKEATDAARQAASIMSGISEVQMTYGECLRSAGDMDAAAEQYRRAIERIPTAPDLYNNLGNVLKDQGLLDEAIAAYRQAFAVGPRPPHLSNLIYTLQYHPAYTPAMVEAELKRYDMLVGDPVKHLIQPHENNREPNRRLRVGYISSEFRQHALGLNLLPLLARHDKSQFEVFCYGDVAAPDFYTFRIRQCADHWQDIQSLSDTAIASMVRRDGIDILLDLHQHIGGNRLPLYALKPAPVQIAFAGYPGSSGLSAMDYRLTDPYLEPRDQPLFPSVEKVLRLPSTWWCYHPVVEIPINDLPSTQGRPFTFGNLNNFCKLNEGVYTLWVRIMQAIDRSELLLLAPEGGHRDRTRAFFEKQGIRSDRIRFVGRQSSADYYRVYQQIDLSLDSFPCNGHTTSMDSFFMGVPVTTIVGNTLFGRATWSQLNNLGLPELAGQTQEEFVALSIDLAKDTARLAELRRTLRNRMKASPLMDDAAFAKGIEAAYREAWKKWSNARQSP